MQDQHSSTAPREWRGNKVSLRPFGPANITPAYVGWLGDRQLMRYSNQRFRSHDTASCQAYLASFEGSGNLFLAIYHEERMVGTMTVYHTPQHGTADIGLLIGPEGQGLGLGRDAWGTMLDHLLASGVRKVTGGTLRCNGAMVRIMQACGMQPDGVRAGQELVDGEPQDVLYFARFAN